MKIVGIILAIVLMFNCPARVSADFRYLAVAIMIAGLMAGDN